MGAYRANDRLQGFFRRALRDYGEVAIINTRRVSAYERERGKKTREKNRERDDGKVSPFEYGVLPRLAICQTTNPL